MKDTCFETLSISHHHGGVVYTNQEWKMQLKLITATLKYFYIENDSNLEACSEDIYNNALDYPLMFSMVLVCKSIKKLHIKKVCNSKLHELNFI
jgi:hypothetical protein